MNLEDMARLSYYKEIEVLNEEHGVFLVKNIADNRIYVKKNLSVYNKAIYNQLRTLDIYGIPKIYECFEDDDFLYVIEEYIHGETLGYVLHQGRVYTDEMILKLVMGICDVLENLHGQNPPIIHRDIKPSNIMITNDGLVKLIDFNAAKIIDEDKTQDTVLMGTENFAAPEQFGFRQSDARTDIYALGVLMNVLSCGEFPRDEIAKGKLHDIIEKCCMLNPDDRYSSVLELENAIAKKYKLPKQKSAKDKKKSLYIFVGVIAAILIIFGMVKMTAGNKKNSSYQQSLDNVTELKEFGFDFSADSEEIFTEEDGGYILIRKNENDVILEKNHFDESGKNDYNIKYDAVIQDDLCILTGTKTDADGNEQVVDTVKYDKNWKKI